MQPCATGHAQGSQRGVVDVGDVEISVLQRPRAQWAHHRQCSGVGRHHRRHVLARALKHQGAAGQVDDEQGGQRAVPCVVGVGGPCQADPGRPGDGSVDGHQCARVGVQAKVLAAVVDHPHPVNHRVEIKARAARQRQGWARAHLCELRRVGVQRVQLAAGRQGKQHTACDAVVDADESVARVQAFQHLSVQHPLRLAGVEADELGRVGHRHHGLRAQWALRLWWRGSAANQQSQSKRGDLEPGLGA